jgi:hypothetical protein
MKTVCAAADPIMAGFLEGILRQAGIPAHVFQSGLQGAAGELPPDQCLARIVVVHPEHLDTARELLRLYLEPSESVDAPGWVCPTCGEGSENQFTQCWQCGWERLPLYVRL